MTRPKFPPRPQRSPPKPEVRHLGLVGDVADPDVPARLVNEAARLLGGLDILITNAGGPPSGTFESFDEAAWQKAIDLSLMSHVRLIKAALPFLRKSKAASVLTITSYSVKQPIPNLVLSNSHPGGHGRADQVAGARTGSGRHPLQLHPARLDRYRTRH